MTISKTRLAALLILTLGADLSANAQPASTDWKPLFDGKTLSGWHHFGEGQWVVEDGAIVGRTQTAAKLYSLLITDAVYHDFTVRLKFKSIKGNSGFYIRTITEDPDKAHGLQIEIDPRNNTGGIYESYRRAWVAKPDPEVYKKNFKLDDWNDLTVAAHGGHVTVTMNNVPWVEIKDDPSRPAGQFAVQMHAGNEVLVMFKDIEIQGEPKKGEDKKGPTSPQKVQAEKNGTLVLQSKHCTITGKALAYMPEWDALGFWRATDHVEWDVEVAKAGAYDVAMEWSVDDKNANNPFVIEAGPHRLEAKVPSTGRWNTYRITKVGQIQLDAGSQKIALKPNGDFKTALMDLRELRLTPAAKPKAK